MKKNSTLDFVLGDGKEVFNEETFSSEEPDTLPPTEEVQPAEFKEEMADYNVGTNSKTSYTNIIVLKQVKVNRLCVG